MTTKLSKEVCSSCVKSINIGQCSIECNKCNQIIHTKCYKKADFQNINHSHYCTICAALVPTVYNPFKTLTYHKDNDGDHFYNNDFYDTIDSLTNASGVLEHCKTYLSSEIKSLAESPVDFTNMFYNIDGNKANFDQFAAELTLVKHNFSIIGLAETNTDPEHACLFPLNNYRSFYNNCMEDKSKGTGVAIYVHESLNATVNEYASTTLPHLETIFLNIAKGGKFMNVGVVYRPPNGSFSEFFEAFGNILEQLPKNRSTFILGDFNINLFRDTSDTNEFEELFLSEGLYPSISLETHKRATSKGSCIDNIFTNTIESTCFSGTIQDIGSHHKPIFTLSQLNLNSCHNKNHKHKQYYNFSKTNIDKVVGDLSSMPPESLGTYSNSEAHCFPVFYQTFTETVDKWCKLEIPKTTKRTTSNNPWITEGIILSIEKKTKLYKNWKKTCNNKNPKGDQKLYHEFSTHRKCLKGIISNAKTKFYNLKIKEHSNDHKKTWEIINQIRGKNKRSIKPSFIINNERILERRIIAQAFNKYFVSIASDMNKDILSSDFIPINPIKSFYDYMPHSNPGSMFLFDCTTDEVSKIISELETGKSSDIPIKLIKRASPVISSVLATHFNHLMETGKFPNELKTGKITPIYKKDDEELLENYRPVSTLPIFGKIFEKIIYKRLYSFFTSQNLIHDKQFGFRQNHSTSHAINYSVHKVTQALKQGEHVLGIFIDLSKAFDTIDHEILLSKLTTYGVRGTAHSLIRSYLTGRKQYVSVLDESSDTLDVEYGVPQGSCLGPLLFLIYINDLCNTSNNCEFVLFADDTNIFVKAKSEYLAYQTANEILLKVNDYMKANKLHINMKKCCYLHFKPSKLTIDHLSNEYKILINGTEIKKVSETKFLGVIIDENLNWDAHIKQLTKKLSSATGVLNRIKDCIPDELHKDLYHTLFESHMCYGITAWGGVSRNKLLPLFRAQKKCIRILFGDKEAFLDKFKTCARTRPVGLQKLGTEFHMKEHTKPIFREKGLVTIHNLHFYHCTMEAFKILKLRTPYSMFQLFSLSQRKDTLLIVPHVNVQFVYKAATFWNLTRQSHQIHEFTHNISSLKITLKHHILSHQSEGSKIEWDDNRNSHLFQ